MQHQRHWRDRLPDLVACQRLGLGAWYRADRIEFLAYDRGAADRAAGPRLYMWSALEFVIGTVICFAIHRLNTTRLATQPDLRRRAMARASVRQRLKCCRRPAAAFHVRTDVRRRAMMVSPFRRMSLIERDGSASERCRRN